MQIEKATILVSWSCMHKNDAWFVFNNWSQLSSFCLQK